MSLNNESYLIIMEHLDSSVAGCLFLRPVGGHEVHWCIKIRVSQEGKLESYVVDYISYVKCSSEKQKAWDMNRKNICTLIYHAQVKFYVGRFLFTYSV